MPDPRCVGNPKNLPSGRGDTNNIGLGFISILSSYFHSHNQPTHQLYPRSEGSQVIVMTFEIIRSDIVDDNKDIHIHTHTIQFPDKHVVQREESKELRVSFISL